MQPTRTRDKTAIFVKPRNWNDVADGVCGDLEVRAAQYGTTPGLMEYVSTWKPSPDDITKMLAGQVIEISFICDFHPPVGLSVVEPVGEQPEPGIVHVADRDIGHDEHGPAFPL